MFMTEQVVGAWVDMWNSYDSCQIDKLFLVNDKLTYFSSAKEGIIKGIKAVHAHHEESGFVPGGKAQENRWWVEDLHASDFGSVVVVTGIWNLRKGSGGTQRGPMTFVYVSQGDDYRLAHLHFANY